MPVLLTVIVSVIDLATIALALKKRYCRYTG